MILSDSIPSRIKMNEFNYYVKIGRVFRKSFPGATAKELAHYAILPLKEDKPDIVIINIGTNSLNKLDACNITTDIFKLIEVCKSYGVDQVYVSGITHREQYVKKITEINNYLRGRQCANDYSFIENDNITKEDLYHDDVHLNTFGTRKLANNFITALNGKHYA